MPTIADVAPLHALLTRLSVDEPLRPGALSRIPLLASRLNDPDWLTLTEAGEAAVVTEVSADGVIPALSVTNRATGPLLLPDGKELPAADRGNARGVGVAPRHGGSYTLSLRAVAWPRRAGWPRALRTRLTAPVRRLRCGRGDQPGGGPDRLPAPAVGLGMECRLSADGLTGAGLAVDDLASHLMAFACPLGVDR